ATAGVALHVFIDADHAHTVEAGRIGDEYRWPSVSTALLAVFHDTASPSATRATERCWQTRASSAHRRARRDNVARGSAAALLSWRHTWRQPAHRYRRIVTSSVVGRHP